LLFAPGEQAGQGAGGIDFRQTRLNRTSTTRTAIAVITKLERRAESL
jgi:hypothetical protein